jgi:hypothetical protein
MHARAIDDAALRLRELRHEEWADIGLGSAAFALSLAASELRPVFAVPLFVGGLVVFVRGVTAVWRRWDLLDRLAGERDAQVIPEVRAYAARETTMQRREAHAASIRSLADRPAPHFTPRIAAAADDLEALARELEDDRLALDPASAVACARLLNDYADSPLLNFTVPSDDLRSRVRRIRAGFEQRAGSDPAP